MTCLVHVSVSIPLTSFASICFNLPRRHRNPAIKIFVGSLSISHLIKHTNLLQRKKPVFQYRRFNSPILVSGHREFTTAMESDRTHLPEPDNTSILESEDFVHIRNKNPQELPVSETEQDCSSVILRNPDSSLENGSGIIPSIHGSGSDYVSENTETEGFEASVSVAEPKKVLSEELSKNVIVLECESSAEEGSCDVYLVGTAHVSQESCREVQAIVSHLKPQVVFLELCSSRVALLTPQNLEVPTMREMLQTYKNRNMNFFGILYSWFLAKVAKKLEVFPGSEFRVAFEEARKYGGKVILGDRPVNITLRRTWGKMTLWHKTKFLFSMLFQAVFLPSPDDLNKMLKEMDDVDMLTFLIQEMSKEFPTMMETLLYERDLYMSSTLLSVAREHSSVVAVVGKGHLQGIKKNWRQPVEVKDLLEIPVRKPILSAAKILTSLGVAVAGAAIISGIYVAGKR